MGCWIALLTQRIIDYEDGVVEIIDEGFVFKNRGWGCFGLVSVCCSRLFRWKGKGRQGVIFCRAFAFIFGEPWKFLFEFWVPILDGWEGGNIDFCFYVEIF